MDTPRKKRPGRKSPPANRKGGGRQDQEPLPLAPGRSGPLSGNGRLLVQVRRIIAATPEVRPDKVALLKKAVDEDAYEIDARQLANILITKLILDP
jgi:anti-sigma28 factor (negative regulator of flagellin synthesis)